MAYVVGPLTVKLPEVAGSASAATLPAPDVTIPIDGGNYIDKKDVARKAANIAGGSNVPEVPGPTPPARTQLTSAGRVAASYLPNPLTLTPTSTLAKWVVLGAVALYAYKSVKDGGVEVAPGRKRSIFIWVDVFIACFVGVYLLRMSREMF